MALRASRRYSIGKNGKPHGSKGRYISVKRNSMGRYIKKATRKSSRKNARKSTRKNRN